MSAHDPMLTQVAQSVHRLYFGQDAQLPAIQPAPVSDSRQQASQTPAQVRVGLLARVLGWLRSALQLLTQPAARSLAFVFQYPSLPLRIYRQLYRRSPFYRRMIERRLGLRE
jgi:hypothetical protein